MKHASLFGVCITICACASFYTDDFRTTLCVKLQTADSCDRAGNHAHKKAFFNLLHQNRKEQRTGSPGS